ncbi:hypothetical protein ON010_g12680 [Phytophthora cinnamomi]|nr:hypothetical protein ON010_g12680 [Phytophthora cinnamomi]
MGTSSSKSSPLAPTFERMATWDLKSSRRLLQDYKDKDLDFGLDAQGLADLLGGDKDWAESIIDAFSSPTGIINALAFICGACLVCSGPALEKAGSRTKCCSYLQMLCRLINDNSILPCFAVIFDALDFDGTEQISMDEMTISFLCSTRGFCVIAGVGSVPSDEELETVTLQAYRDLNKGSTQSITKAEFMKWIIEFASGTGAPPTREVTLQNALEQFRVVPPSEKVEGKEENNATLLQDGSELGGEYQDESDQNDEQHFEDPLQQEIDMPDENAGEFAVDQEHNAIEHPAEFTEPVAPEHVATETDGQRSDGDVLADGHNEFNPVEAETTDCASIDDCGQADEQMDGQVDDAEENTEAEQLSNDNYEPGIETDQHPEATADDAESDYPTFVADGDELPQGSKHFTNEEQDQNASRQEQNSDLDTATFGAGAIQQDNDNNLETQDTEPVSASEQPAAGESTSADDVDNDDLLYEQDEFAQETPRSEREAEPEEGATCDDNLVHESPIEDPEQNIPPADVPIEATTEELEPATTDGEAEVTVAQGFADPGIEVDENPEPIVTPDSEPAESTHTAENTETGDEGVTEAPVDAAVDPAEEPATDLNAFDTYDYEQPQFDGSSGLPPPEPQELIDDAAAVDVVPEAGDAPKDSPEDSPADFINCLRRIVNPAMPFTNNEFGEGASPPEAQEQIDDAATAAVDIVAEAGDAPEEA